MSVENREITDLVMLGRGAPDTMTDGRVTLCAAGWSPTLGFIRIYPTKITSPLNAWNIVSVPVERNPQDSRPESWKIQGSRAEWDNLDQKIEVVGELKRPERLELVRKLARGCVRDLNDSHQSLGIIKPSTLVPILAERSDVDEAVQTTLWGHALPKTKAHYTAQPRLQYTCTPCRAPGGHDQQIIEWGCYEWFRKHPGKEEQVFDNLRIRDDEWEKYLFVGNQNNHRTSYIVINVIRWKKSLKEQATVIPQPAEDPAVPELPPSPASSRKIRNLLDF